MSHKSRARITRPGNTRSFLIGLAILVVILVLVVTALPVSQMNDQTPETTWSVDESYARSFSHRDLASPQAILIEDTANYSLEKIRDSNDDTMVYGLLRVPKNMTNPPVVVVLPAATVSKEADSAMANALCSWGYASLTLDERGNGGETQGAPRWISRPAMTPTAVAAYQRSMPRSTMCC